MDVDNSVTMFARVLALSQPSQANGVSRFCFFLLKSKEFFLFLLFVV
jgi:hypothetical protein